MIHSFIVIKLSDGVTVGDVVERCRTAIYSFERLKPASDAIYDWLDTEYLRAVLSKSEPSVTLKRDTEKSARDVLAEARELVGVIRRSNDGERLVAYPAARLLVRMRDARGRCGLAPIDLDASFRDRVGSLLLAERMTRLMS